MTKKQAKIKALYIAGDLCLFTDLSMFNDGEYIENEEIKIINALHEIGHKLIIRAKKLEKKNKL